MIHDYYSFISPFHVLSSFLGWLIFFIIVLWIIRMARGTHYAHGIHRRGLFRDSAMDIIREKYARGDISKEEFEEKKKHLSD